MKEQVLKLCRRLKSCTLNDLTQFLEVEESIVETIILYLEQENLIQITNGIITLSMKFLTQLKTFWSK